MAMGNAIETIERLCQQKLIVFQELLTVFRNEKKCIIKADVGSLWSYTRQKNELSEKITEIRREIMDVAIESDILNEDDAKEYSLLKIINALPKSKKATLVNLRLALTSIKTHISALAHENRKYLEESMKTIEDLVHIIIQNSERSEHYGRDSYLKRGPARCSGLVLGEV
jgi:hypothetical protein